MSIPLAVRKCLIQTLNCTLSGIFHGMPIYLFDHVGIYMTGDTDDRNRIHSKRNQMRNTGMTTGIRSKYSDIVQTSDGLLIQGSKIRIIAGKARFLGRFPNELFVGISQVASTVSNKFWDRNRSIA